MASYDAYLLAMLLPPLLIVPAILVVSCIAWGVSYILYTNQKRRADKETQGKSVVVEYPGLQHMFTVLQPMFGGGLEARITRDRVRVKLYGENISPAAVPLLVQSLVLALGLSLAVFLSALVVDDSRSTCDEKLDCFPFNYSRQAAPLTRDPIRNCSAYAGREISVRCFSFSVRLVEALGSAGGILALTTLGISLYVVLLFTLARINCCRRTGVCGFLLIATFGCVIFLSSLLWILPLGIAQWKTLTYVKNWESVLVYYYSVLYLLLTLTLLPCCVPRYRRDFERCCSGHRRGYQAPEILETDEEEEGEEEGERGGGRDGSRRRIGGYHVAIFHNGRRSQSPRYYGSVDERQYTQRSTGVDQDPHIENADTGEIAVLDVESEKSVYHKPSARDKHGNGRGKRRGSGRKHWADMEREIETEEEEEEWSTTSRREGERGRQDTQSSSVSQEEEGLGERRRRRHREGGTAKIRDVLTGGVVGDGDEKGVVSVHTHL